MVDELARSGVEHAVLCPGSRNAAVLLALDAHPQIACWSAVDERSAGFLALGIAKATGRPAAVCVTSGTALSNLAPAATEAHEAGTPLLLLTADRPAELRDVGAGQTIDQLRALDAITRWTVELDLSDATIKAADLGLLVHPAELELIRVLAAWPRTVAAAAVAHEPHRIAFYLHDVAAAFHAFWAKGKEDPQLRFVNVEQPKLTLARLALVDAVRQVLLNGLTLLGVSAPEELS